MNNGTSFHFSLKPERNKSPLKKKEDKRKKAQLDKQLSHPNPCVEQWSKLHSILTEFTVCLKTVYYKHI